MTDSMFRSFTRLVAAGLVSAAFLACGRAAPAGGKPQLAIVTEPGASPLERLASQEVRRYWYLRTGEVLPTKEAQAVAGGGGGSIVVARKDRGILGGIFGESEHRGVAASLEPGQYWIKSLRHRGRPVVVVAGGDDLGTLYGAYRLAEHLGVRFYLHGDVVPDDKRKLGLPSVDDRGMPLFELRGIQPFHDFPEGPDWWSRDDYQSIVAQLPKLRMNFLGLHTYPEGGPNAEPTVWIGRPDDIGNGTKVKSSYPASYQNTLRGNWGYAAKKTSEFLFGASSLFEHDAYGCDVMIGACPQPADPAACNALFDRTGELLCSAFTLAHRLGIKTCVGTETPLTVPKVVADRLRAAGMNLDDTNVTRMLYEGIFQRATQAYPLDYYWFWTPEGWTWEGTKDEQIKRTLADVNAAIAAARSLKVPLQLATCGWVLGPQQDRALFDKVLPKDIAVSCINREVGKTPVDKGFAEVGGRGKWAIPWLEDDPALTSPQLWVGRMRRDAADARRYGCNGLMGIHWRTRVLAPNLGALAQAAWTQDPWNKSPFDPLPLPARAEGPAYPSTLDFYADWATHEFGRNAGPLAAAILEKVDCKLPRPADWVDGPGGIRPDARPWSEVARDYEFVDQFATVGRLVKGAGNEARFEYWRETFAYMRAMARLNCVWGAYNKVIEKVKALKDAEARKNLALEQALPLRRELVSRLAAVYDHMLATVSTMGELGTVANWDQHLLPTLLTKPGEELAAILGQEIPADAQPSREYRGSFRLIVPTVRSSLATGEALKLKAIILDRDTPPQAALFWRKLGAKSFTRAPIALVNRAVYSVEIPAAAIANSDFEYYIEAVSKKGARLRFPATAPGINQTVVVMPWGD